MLFYILEIKSSSAADITDFLKENENVRRIMLQVNYFIQFSLFRQPQNIQSIILTFEVNQDLFKVYNMSRRVPSCSSFVS